MPTNVRRSTRNSRSRVIYSPDSAATLKQNKKDQTKPKVRVSGILAVSHKLLEKEPEKKEEVVVETVKESDEEYTVEEEQTEKESVKKKLVWNNYTKKDLYYHWVKARNDATDLRKEKSELDDVRKEQTKYIKDLKKDLKVAETQLNKQNTIANKNGNLLKQLDDEKAKCQRNRLEKQQLIENKEILIKNIQENYENMSLKNKLEATATLQEYQLKFAECKLKLDSKIAENKTLLSENKDLKQRQKKLDALLFAKSKADMEVKTMDEKNQLR